MSRVSFKKAALINASSRYLNIIIYIVFNAIASRLLTPEEYGIFAVTTIFTTFFSKIYDSGFGAAIIQDKGLQRNDVCSIHTFMCYVGLALALAFAALGAPISAIYKNSAYIRICMVLAVGIFFNTVSIVPYSYLLREKRFFHTAALDVAGGFFSYAIALVLVFAGFKYYALAAQVVIQAFIKFTSSKLLTGISARRKIDKRPLRRVLPFTLYELGSMIINYFELNLDNILVSLTMGSTMLGYYNKSYTLSRYPVSAVAGAVSPVLHPVLSDYQSNPEEMYRKYIRFLLCVSTVAIAVASCCFGAAREIILILYGGQWEACVPSFRYLTMCIYPVFMMSGNIGIYKSLGRTDLLFRAVVINAAVTTLASLVGVLMGSIETVALCVCIANWSNMFMTLFILNRFGFKSAYLEFWRHFLPDLIALFGIQLIYTAVFQRFLWGSNVLLLAFEKCAAIGVMYAAYMLISKRYVYVLSLLSRKRRRDL